jgi:molecular chaperone GrpE (heat shock protein)
MSSPAESTGPPGQYLTQEDELRAKEAEAENFERAEEATFLEAFQTAPKKRSEQLFEKARNIIDNFNAVMSVSRLQPYEKQEELMSGLKKLLNEQIKVIEARRIYTIKINPKTSLREGGENSTIIGDNNKLQ